MWAIGTNFLLLIAGKPDPYVIITYQNSPNPPLKLGETSKLSDTQNPIWPETFNVIYLNGSSQVQYLVSFIILQPIFSKEFDFN